MEPLAETEGRLEASEERVETLQAGLAEARAEFRRLEQCVVALRERTVPAEADSPADGDSISESG